MDKYYVDKNVPLNGIYVLHKEGCSTFMSPSDKFQIGSLSNVDKAMEKATLLFSNVKECKDCLPFYSLG